jgi:hypothetical protein
MAGKPTPVLIYAPGLGRYSHNTADGVADVLARTIDRLLPEEYSTKTDAAVTAPKGLRVGKTIIDGKDRPVLQLFELDYLGLLEPDSGVAGRPVVPGLVRSVYFALLGLLKLLFALRRPGKTWTAKAQLLLGFAGVLVLVFAATVAVYSVVFATGRALPFAGVFGPEAAPWVFGMSSLGFVAGWSAVRKHVLAMAGSMEWLMRFVTNQSAIADTVALVVDEAVDGLRQNDWNGSIHLLGFSFGSLVLFESLFPRPGALRSASPVAAVSSLTTIGCPIDLVRLYQPSYIARRAARRPGLPWTNVFNTADVFSSNLRDEDDHSEGVADALPFASPPPASIRYLDQGIGPTQIFTSGRVHAGYWGTPARANCFDPLVMTWLK